MILGRMRLVAWLLLTVLLVAACGTTPNRDPFDVPPSRSGSPSAPEARPLRAMTFQTPSGNIGCLFAYRQLRCDIWSGMSPQPTRYACPSVSHWAGVVLSAEGAAVPNCAGDTVVDPSSVILTYGRTWERGDLTCLARRTGLRCVNAQGGGFTLARAGWTTFLDRTLTTDTFQTPSGNIVCGFMPSGVRCDLHSGLRPEPGEPCPVDWVGTSLEAEGVAGPNCAGDAVPGEAAPILERGYDWQLAGIECSSEATGLTCTNEQGRGFFLSRVAWRTF
jgi:Family of unknown function (DUF6636)